MDRWTRHRIAPSAGATGAMTGMLLAAPTTLAALTPVERSEIQGLQNVVELNFAQDGNGSPLSVNNGGPIPPGGSRAMPADEYAGLGFSWSESIDWVYDGSSLFQLAQQTAGALDGPFSSPDTTGHVAIPGPDGPGDDGTFSIDFEVPVLAFGFLVITDRLVGESAPTFEAYDTNGDSLGVLTFDEGGEFVDGSIPSDSPPPAGSPFIEWGFLDVVSDTPIASIDVTIEDDNSILDEFIFAQIPAPATLTAAALALAFPRRRRRH